MADLPNINTANVGIIAFWNAEDHKTAGVVDPLDCTGVFTSYDVYDNGLDGVIALGSGRNFNCRVKNDGWCVAWIDRTNTFGYPTKDIADFGESGYKGYYDILWNWFNANSDISSTLTTLSYIISLLEAALETSGDFAFDAGDVGHYCYEYTGANVFTMANLRVHQDTRTAYTQYTSGTTLYHASVTGRTIGQTTQGKFVDNMICNGHEKAGTADILAENWMPDALADYASWGYSGQAAYGSHNCILLLWS